MSFNIWPQKILQCLDHSLRLTMCLGIERRAEPKICTKQVEQARSELAGISRISVRDYHLWEAMDCEDRVDKDPGVLWPCQLFRAVGKMDHFWHSIQEDHNRYEAIGLW